MTKPRKLTADEQAAPDAAEGMADDEIDISDVPEVRDWSGTRRGLLYRPVKRQLTLRLDADIVEWFRTHTRAGEGYQTRINAALREYVAAHRQKRKPGDHAS
jgi:uncharacterized protein (DUF4415 family)